MKDKKRFQKIKKGNQEAFKNLYKKYYDDLVRFVWSYVSSENIAQEIVQDIFLMVWEDGRELDIEEDVKAYLFNTARNMSIDYIRHKEVESDWRDEKKALFDATKRPKLDERLHQKMILKEVKQAIQELPQKRREIFMLSRYGGMTYQEIADFLDISVNTVKTQMGRALKSLREVMGKLTIVASSFIDLL